MADFDHSSTPPRSMAHRKAMDQFAVPKQGSAAIQHELSLARKAVDANTARLRELRLAKEAADAAYLLANPLPPKPARKPRKKIAAA